MPVLRRDNLQRKQRLQAELDRIVQVLAGLGARKVILFGSLARGAVRPDSDLDLIVIYDTAASFMARLDALYTALQPRLAVDLLAYTPQEWEQMQTSAFVRRALAEGQVIYEA